ncbi:cytosol aminopeptidase, putative [Eimeria tenella]|uniref:Cytosol aminopeptidase, putative n=1 Tax=Eimeria tenella TaxID=5802 RepID=U6KUY7_EIMTE|nr:cytosol aminopeptidase, putative [Eimeria tenella]CDJ40179.1 cytosol aminopeptidase, putative [Eimeria tenella]|eukprot:XP_013230932.1 cytosol aminopeptidase, putative [Eimeria tenella]
MVPPQPRTVKTDPPEMPLTECRWANKIKFSVEPLSAMENYKGDCFVFVSKGALSPQAAAFDEQRGALLAGAIEEADFKGDAGSVVSVRVPGGAPRYLMAVGCGEHKTFDAQVVGAAVAAALREKSKIRSAALYIPDLTQGCPCPEAPKMFLRKLQSVLETILVEMNPDNRFKGTGTKNLKTSEVEQLTIFAPNKEGTEAVLQAARHVAAGVHFARELVNSPANYCTTVTLAKAAESLAAEFGLECKILGQAEVEALGMGCYLGVCKGSMYPPQFIHLTYRPKGATDGAPGAPLRKLAFVGKGLCFDSGGYNIKRAETSIELMKFDMGGAAAVLGAARALGLLQPAGVEVHFVAAAAENMVSSQAYRPGDVLTASNGKTVEVGNTDAEGRLTLADALVFAEKLEVDAILDVATLTGACVVALGESYAGLFSPDDQLAEKILKCADRSCEKMWRMPFVSRYRENLESKCADLNNTATKGKGGGAITAAVFLKEFVEKTPWAHIDIAGPAWCSKSGSATGYGVRTLVEFALTAAQ